MMEKDAKIYVAGHRGMVGSAIVRELERQGYTNIITRTHKELDLCRQNDVEAFFAEEKPEYVFLAAAKVGGIIANQNALADFMYDNMILEMNVIGKDLGTEILRVFEPTVRYGLHQRHADESLWTERQLSSHTQPRSSGADPPFPRGEGKRSGVCDLLGRRFASARVPVC